MGGGGGAKDYVRARTSRARSPKSLTSGVQLWALDALGVFDALSRYLSLTFKHSDTKWNKTKHSRSNFRGRTPVAPPLNPPLIMKHAAIP